MATLKLGDRGSDVHNLQEHLKDTGYFGDVVDGVFGKKTESAVKTFQSEHGLNTDGIVGPDTQAQLDIVLSEVLRHAKRERNAAELDIEPPDVAPLPDTAKTVDAGSKEEQPENRVQEIIQTAVAEWSRPVHEPPGVGWERIDSYIRGDQGLGWSWEKRYTQNGQFYWCGAFASYCYGQAGLKADVRRQVLPSTYRLYRWAKDTSRMVPADEVQRGDIVIVGPGDGKRWGAHITICDEADTGSGSIKTLEGNAHGMGPDGESYEGVIRQIRPLDSGELPTRTYRVLYAVRPALEDYV